MAAEKQSQGPADVGEASGLPWPRVRDDCGDDKAKFNAARKRKQSDPFPQTSQQPRRPSFLKRWHTDRKASAHNVARNRTATDDDYDSSSEDDYMGFGITDNALTQSRSRAGDHEDDTVNAPAIMNEGEYRKILLKNQHCSTTGRFRRDGRLRLTVNETAHKGYLVKALGAALDHQRPSPSELKAGKLREAVPFDTVRWPRINVVIMVVGSRGDVQPFLRIGKFLRDEIGHRVRIATHPAFKDLVEKDSGLEFFSIGGDPSELMAFMVKNPGMIPTFETIKAGEIGRRRAAMAEMFDGFWRACIHGSYDAKSGEGDPNDVFIADAIIANPPSFAHLHCAEALGVPLHLVFTFPYTPTQAFPHPLASIKQTNLDQGYANFISYPLVETMTWQGLGDLVNKFRVKSLALDPVSTLWAPNATYRMRVPVTYLWSPGLVPKPEDWGEEIEVTGFVFLDLASSYTPPDDLVKFLEAGEPPIYIGFGSIVVDDPESFTDMIFDAVEKAGVRALVSKGWGGFGRDDVPDNIYMLDNIPHDWLFPRIKACVHHGGAGTTAIGLKCALPTMIVPFFGDQHFWGSMVGKSGAGPMPTAYKHLDADTFAEGIRYLLTDEAKTAASNIAACIERDGDGARNAMQAFKNHFDKFGPPTLRCGIITENGAVWQVKGMHVRLSPLAAEILVSNGYLTWKKLRLLRHTEWNDFEGPGEPITGVVESLKNSLRDTFSGIGGAPYRVGRTARARISGKLRQQRKKQESKAKAAAAASSSGSEEKSASESAADGQALTREETKIHIPGPEQYAVDIGTSFGMTALAIIKAPASLVVALAQGFHNAPKLYGDDTVRRPTRVTGLRSGFKASGKEFVFGLYDGVTGVVTQPVRGAKENGGRGFARGAAMGLTGLVLKSISAVIGPFGYSMQGFVKQAERHRTPEAFVRRARMTQGQQVAAKLDEAALKKTTEETIAGWKVMQELQQAIVREESHRGVAGQVDKLTFDTMFMFLSVTRAKECLDDLKSGKSLESVRAAYASWSTKAHDPMKAKRGTFNNSMGRMKPGHSSETSQASKGQGQGQGHQEKTTSEEAEDKGFKGA